MKTLAIKTIICFLLIQKICYGQSIESDSSKSIKVRIDGLNSQKLSWRSSPLYIVTADNKRLQIPENGNFKDTVAITNIINYINTDWIKSIDVLKGKNATDLYDSLGRNNVVLIELKKGSLKKFPPKIRKKFKDN